MYFLYFGLFWSEQTSIGIRSLNLELVGPMFEEPESGSPDISLGLCFDLSRRNGIMSSDGT